MAKFPFEQVDVFTQVPFKGNPVAVVFDADHLDTQHMQAIATWTNLSETTFVLAPTAAEADYRLRIFTPSGELPFAGHPTIGSAHAIISTGRAPAGSTQLTQECKAGLLDLEVSRDSAHPEIFVTLPPPQIQPLPGVQLDQLAGALQHRVAGAQPLIIDVGPRWLIVQLADAQQVHALQPDGQALLQLSTELGITGITAFGFGDASEPVYVRSFAPAVGVPEDPVCGSGNGCVGAFIREHELQAQCGWTYAARQGAELGRDGHVRVRIDPQDRNIAVGGRCVTGVSGELRTT